jgi:Zn-dependent metalloprotease
MGAGAAQEGNSDEDAVAMAKTRATHPNGAARYIVTEALRGRLNSKAGDWGGRAFEVVESFRGEFGLASPRAQLALRNIRGDLAGGQHVRLSQTHRGIGVEGAELVVHFDRSGEPTSVTGIVVPHLDLDTTPVLPAEQAGATAVQTVQAAAPGEQLGIGDARLVIYNDGLVRGTSAAAEFSSRSPGSTTIGTAPPTT